MADDKSKYKMTIDMNVLNHLGINLYSSIPAVLSEAVANAWDADAENVEIVSSMQNQNQTITITDDGHGMSVADINDKFLKVGYQRRDQKKPKGDVTKKLNRPVMGRKGIGKLSLFSIANTIEVVTKAEGSNEVLGFSMSWKDINRICREDDTVYCPEVIDAGENDFKGDKGSKIVLRDFRHDNSKFQKYLRRRLARRFSVIGTNDSFQLKINGELISKADKDYYEKLQHVWIYGDYAASLFPNAKVTDRKNKKHPFSGWIGTVQDSGQLKVDDESLNKIGIMVRGKLAQDDVLRYSGETGIYSSYVIGVIHADYLDDERDDIATTSRQSIVEDDVRFVDLKTGIKHELKFIQSQWKKLRKKEGVTTALSIDNVQDWFDNLSKDDQKRAKSLLGKITEITHANSRDRIELYKFAVLGFESLKAKRALEELENISGEEIVKIGEVFGQLDTVEAFHYRQITSARMAAIDQLRQAVHDNTKEKVIQKLLFNHLWLLDPSWERATSTEFMEKKITNAWKKVHAKMGKEELKGRIDIGFRKSAGKYVIIELKRPNVGITTTTLLNQVEVYKKSLVEAVRETEENPRVEIICVVGKAPSDWGDYEGKPTSVKKQKAIDARIVLYAELIETAYKAYQEYKAKTPAPDSPMAKIIDSLDKSAKHD